MDILPAIDLREGRCVRLLQGDYDHQIHYADDPVGTAKEFEQAGAQWVHIVDLDGAKSGQPTNHNIAKQIARETSLKVELGGGLRNTETIEALLNEGIARCVVGTKALQERDWFEQLVHSEKAQNKIALGLDAREGRLAVQGWTQELDMPALEVAELLSDWPLAAIIYTDIGRDGMLLGPNLDATRVMAERSHCPVIASGGVSDLDDVKLLAGLPLGGIIIGRAIYEKQIALADALKIVA